MDRPIDEALQTASQIFQAVLTAPGELHRLLGAPLTLLLATPGGRAMLIEFGFTPVPHANEWVMTRPPTVAASEFGDEIILAAARARANGGLTLDIFRSLSTAAVRQFSFKWVARSPLLRIGDRATEMQRVAATGDGAVCKFCLRRGPEMSLACSTCRLRACAQCDWRSHITTCARCMRVIQCATCLHADAAMSACHRCRLLVCDPVCALSAEPNPLPCRCP